MAAQNIHVFLPKLPLHKKHFFGWLKAANFSIVCGTVTLKSPPSRGTDAPRVHPRPRKRLSRCTLDCGFKTSESPAMRGFVAERGQIRGTSLYLVLKSNGPHCSKKPSCKVRLFVQNHSRKYRPKVTITTLFQTVSHPAFQLLSQTAHVRSHSRKWVHTRPSEKNRTQRLTRRSRGVSDGGAVTLGTNRTFPNLPWPGIRTANFAAFGSWSGVLPKHAESLRNSDALMRVAAPLGCVIFFCFYRNCSLHVLRLGLSAYAR